MKSQLMIVERLLTAAAQFFKEGGGSAHKLPYLPGLCPGATGALRLGVPTLLNGFQGPPAEVRTFV